MSAAAVSALAAVAALALAMVYAMVQWATAVLQAPPPADGEPLLSTALARPAARRWGAVYLALWIALAGAFLALFAALGERRLGGRLALLVAIAAGWIGFSALLVAFASALARAAARG